jgi:predicted dehydrogenase
MKILIVGLGAIGQRHLSNLRTLQGDKAEFIACRVRRLNQLITANMATDPTRNLEQEHPVSVFTSLDEALSLKPEIAFVCNPSRLHIAAAMECAAAGCDLFIEKPLADSLEGANRLVSLAARNARIAMVGYQMRFHPCLRKLSEIVHGGALGNLLSARAINGEYLPNWHPYEDYRQSYAARSDLGGGALLTQIHEFDYLYSLFGLPSRIFAVGGHWSHLEIDVEDTASTLMECTVGGRPFPVHLHQDYLQSPPRKQCEVIGDRGRAIMDLVALSVTVFTLGNPEPEIHNFPGFERNQLFLDEAGHFLECVKTRNRPIVDLHDGLQSLRMALAAKESMRTRQPVELDSTK